MKTIFLTSLVVGVAGVVLAQPAANQSRPDSAAPAPTAYQITERGANHRVWQRDTYIKSPDGHIIPQHHAITELAPNLYYKDAHTGEWTESKELIEPFAGGAIARQGAYQVIFANNLNTAGAVDVQEPDGKRLRSNILGLAYYDRSTGQSAVIAQVQDAQGKLIGSNQVLFADAFSGAHADVRYTYKKASLEQDVVVREQLPSPESFNLNPETTELEVMTEFLNPPAETVQEQETDGDQEVSWGVTRLGHGRAFDLGDQDSPVHDFHNRVSVKRQYGAINGRKILLERVSLPAIQAGLQKLPRHAGIPSKSKFKTASKKLQLPSAPLAQTTTQPMHIASASSFAPSGEKARMRGQVPSTSPGYVLDYVAINANVTNLVFRADNTYYVSDDILLTGTPVIEGGTVVKTANTLDFSYASNIVCQTAAYCPAVFTSVNDDTVGETLPASTGTPVQGDAGTIVGTIAQPATLSYLHVKYFDVGVDLNYGGSPIVLRNVQFINCDVGLLSDGPTITARNLLLTGSEYAFAGSDSAKFRCENATIDQCTTLTYDYAGVNCTLNLTNSLVVAVPDWGNFPHLTTNCTATAANSTDVFQIAGAGSHYLPTNSPYLTQGTTNIDPALLVDLTAKTTWPPLIYSNTPLAGGTYSPSAQRDVTGTALGYHYDSLDYCLGRADATSNVVFTAGTAVGWFDLHATGSEPYNSYGLGLSDALSVTYAGTVTAPCVQAKYSTVQEGNGNWADVSPWSFEGVMGGVCAIGSASYNPAIAATINARFTLFSGHANTAGVGNDYSSDLICRFTDCVLNSGRAASYNLSLYFTNCLCQGLNLYSICYGNVSACIILQNCTLHEGQFNADRVGYSWPIKLQNSAFEAVDFSPLAGKSDMTDPAITYCDYNAFVTNAARLPMIGSHDVTVTNFNWQTSWLGNYYLPPDSPLIDVGSINANMWGLYYFTTQTNQTEETSSIVDIGYHYAAIDSGTGQPFATFTNGVPDYVLDTHGNGLPDWWEYYWFGNYDYSSTNIDSSGNTFLSDYINYTNGTPPYDPNVINFIIGSTNMYVNHTNVLVQMAVYAGAPAYYATSVNTTNTGTWLTFSSTNLSVNLGTTDGVYTVRVSLKGISPEATETWREYNFYVDRVPPTLTITNPVLSGAAVTVVKPYLQLIGAADEPSYSLSYDLSNAAGLFTNRDVLVSDQYFDTNAFAFTTNYFQGYDLPLVTNANWISLHVTDRAGNTTTTNFTVTLDYTGATNPLVTVIWP
ncbi:MAG TPA: hypothetical protein VG347_16320, partial [Verrucomicrobiae bacterium]|nr:hypothetical protein [Verrucomicrobiae bacterium]